MKLILSSSVVLLACSHCFAQCTDPINPDCISTNNPTGTNWTPQVLPPGSLQFSFISPNQFGVTNTEPDYIYQIQALTNLELGNWSFFASFTNGDGLEKVFDYTNQSAMKHFRVINTGAFWDYEEVEATTNNIATCAGPYIGTVDYYRDLNWGYPVDSNKTTHALIDLTGNHYIEAIGRFGDLHCGFGSVIITNPPSAEYRFTLFFKTNRPTEDYGVILEGWVK